MPPKHKRSPSEDDVLRRMLNTPPKPHKPKPEGEALTPEEIEKLRQSKREQNDYAAKAFKKKKTGR